MPLIRRMLDELEASMGTTGGVKSSVTDLRRFGFSGRRCFEALIARKDRQAVGFALFFPEFSSWRGQPGVYIQDLYVASAARRTGLGRALIEAVYQHAMKWDAAYCKLATRRDNTAAIAFYEQLGFEVIEDECTLVVEIP